MGIKGKQRENAKNQLDFRLFTPHYNVEINCNIPPWMEVALTSPFPHCPLQGFVHIVEGQEAQIPCDFALADCCPVV